jgi:hypothetical protein
MVRLEAEAKLFIQELIRGGKVDLVWSFVLDYENSKNPFQDRQEQIGLWRNLAKVDCALNGEIRNNALLFVQMGLKQADAAHLACAVYAGVDYFITTDRRIISIKNSPVKIVNPISFLQEEYAYAT